MDKVYDTIVIGAGYSGLTAARDLDDRGRSVLVLEGRDRIGGRAFHRTFRGRDDIVIDAGGAFVSRSLHPLLAREMDRYGVELVAAPMEVQNVAFSRQDGSVYKLPVPPSQLADLERALVHMAVSARRINGALPYAAQPVADLDVSPREFFAPLELPEETLGFLVDFATGYLAGESDCVSMLQLLSWVGASGGSPYDLFFAVFDQTFKNSSTEILVRLVEQADFELRLAHPVRSVTEDGDRVRVTTDDGEEFLATHAIVAVPANTLKHLEIKPFAVEKERLARAAKSPFGVKQYLIVEGAPPRFFGVGREWLFTRKELPDGTTLMIRFSPDQLDDMSDLVPAQATVDRYLPGAKVLAADGHNWERDRFSEGGAWKGRPGSVHQFGPVMSEPTDRISYAVSDISSSPWTGWIEGAVTVGHRAAHEVLTKKEK